MRHLSGAFEAPGFAPGLAFELLSCMLEPLLSSPLPLSVRAGAILPEWTVRDYVHNVRQPFGTIDSHPAPASDCSKKEWGVGVLIEWGMEIVSIQKTDGRAARVSPLFAPFDRRMRWERMCACWTWEPLGAT